MRAIIIAATSTAMLFSSAAFTQELSQGTTLIPDFSGMWSYPYFPSFELPLSGPGPVVNKSRRRQLLDADGRPLPAATAPLAGSPLQLVGDYTNPILKPEAAEIVRKHGELELSGGAPTPSNQCWPLPVPYILGKVGMQMLQRPDRITILYFGDQARHVRMNQPHPTSVSPSWYGDFVGHYGAAAANAVSQSSPIYAQAIGGVAHRTIVANGIHLHFAEQGEGPLVVLCHGFPESWYSWRHQLPALSAAGFRAVAVDMRGYGQSDRPEAIDQYTLLHLVGDMVGLLDALGAEQAVIAGHDWGAPVAWHAALLRPDRFRAVIGLSVPFMSRSVVFFNSSAAPPTSIMPRRDDAIFYQLYFQTAGSCGG